MKSAVAFAAGFITGWLSRSAVATSRGAAVTLLAFVLELGERVRRRGAIEREWFDDLVAEARARAADGKWARATDDTPCEPVGRAA
jgi:hypothetical protein